jgi:DHA1 family tetracycline resistance protein-like MFS transporter
MPPSEPARRGKPMLVAFITIFLDLIGFGIVIPVQPFYAESYGAAPWAVTLLGASYSLMQFLFSPFWGGLSDRVGRRKIVLTSVALSGIGHLCFGFAPTLVWLFAARMLAGFGNANVGTAQAIISDVTTPETRAKGMGLIGAAFGLGFIFGPAIGGALSQISPQAPFFGAAALALVNFVSAALFLPETRRFGEKAAAPRHGLSFAALKDYFGRPGNIPRLLVVTFLTTLAFAMMEQTCGLYIEHAWLGDKGLTAAEHLREASRLTAYYLVVVGIVATIIQGGLIGRLQRRFGEVGLVRTGVILLAVGLALLPPLVSSLSQPLFYFSGILLATGSALLTPASQALVSRSASQDEQGEALGLNQSLSALGRVIGPASAGFLFGHRPGLPFYFAAALMVVGLCFTVKLTRPGAA